MDMSNKRKRAARQLFTELSNSLKARDFKQVYEISRAKIERLGASIPSTLNAFWDDIKTMASLMEYYSTGRYRDVPWRSLTAMGSAMMYFVTPLDALPDFIPLVGYLDDAFIFKLVFDLVGKDLEDFRRWRDGGVVIDHDRI